MKTILICRLLAITFFCLTSLAIKSEQTVCKTKCSKLSTTRIMIEPKVEFTSYERGPLPLDDGFIIKI